MSGVFRKVLALYDGDAKQATQDFANFDSILRYGRDLDNKKISMKDAVALPNANIMVPQVLTTIVREAIEPMLIGTSLLQRLDYTPGMEVMMPDVGALYAEEIGKNNQEFPEFDMDIGQGQTNQMRVTRKGLALKFPDRIIENDQFGLYVMWTRLGLNALARFKEEKIFEYITAMGTTVFDNINPGASILGGTTGRNLSGQYNGSFTVDDLFDMYSQCLAQGFRPDTLLVHPLAWAMFVKDPVMRQFAMQNGGGSFFAGWDGDFNQNSGWSNFGGLGEGQGQNVVFGPAVAPSPSGASAASAYQQTMNSAPRIPEHFPFPLRVVASPFMPFSIQTVAGEDVKTTDVIMFSSQMLGALVVEKDPSVDEWRDIKTEFNWVRMSESYGLHMFDQGQGIVSARNVYLTDNKVVGHAQPVVDVSAPAPLDDGPATPPVDPDPNTP